MLKKFLNRTVFSSASMPSPVAPPASSSTMVAEFIAIEPSTTSGHAKSVARARSVRNAPALPSGALSSTRTNQLGNVHGSWSTRKSSPKHSGKESKVEALFAELKNQIGLRRLRLRRLRFVREQFFLAAVAQTIKRLVRFLSQPTTPVLPATT